MRSRTLALSLLLGALLGPAAAGATDSPHDGASFTGACSRCHTLHGSVGGTLTDQPDNNTVCTTCHASTVWPGNLLGLPFLSPEQATPGVGGLHHRWDASAINAARGATTPTLGNMAAHLATGSLQCSTCHDPHAANPSNATRALHVSFPVNAPQVKSGTYVTSGAGGSATLTIPVKPAAPAAQARGYRVRIASVTGTGGTFIVSHDARLTTPSWFNWSGSGWVPGSATGAGMPYTNGASVAVDDPAVTVAISAGAQVGDYWDFYVGYPFMRAAYDADELCLDCHSDRNQTHACVEGLAAGCAADGVKVFSHPVQEALNANGQGYDAAAPLDADGGSGAGGDTNPTNDLVLDGSGRVRCTTCHSVHNADSNSLTVDNR